MGKVSYTVIVEWDPGEELYIATIPALSVSSYAESKSEVIDKIREAAEVTIEGLTVTGQPVPVGDGDTVTSVEVLV